MPSTGRNPTSNSLPPRRNCTALSVRTAVTSTEYKRYVDSLKGSVLTAFYTPKEITDTLASVLAGHGVVPARLLEPSAGMGAFVDSMLRHAPQSRCNGFRERPADGPECSATFTPTEKCV
mgnify:CR=1 FL=1